MGVKGEKTGGNQPMRCPQCSNNQKYKDGMTCNHCAWKFALNPKERPYISDMAFYKAVENVSGNGHYYFTHNQLFAQVFRMIRRKGNINEIAFITGQCIIGSAALLFLMGVDFKSYLIPLFFLGAVLTVITLTRRFAITQSRILNIINSYNSLHPLENMVNGKRFKGATPPALDNETVEYAPERILIVDGDDIADMLIMNRFHFQNKTLVLSAEKYPSHAFDACQAFLRHHPDIPVCLIHDASIKGRRMKERVVSDGTWNINPANVRDLGLFPRDMQRLKHPMWLPHPAGSTGDAIVVDKKAEKNIRDGYRMPVDAAPPKAMMGGLGPAVVSGMALLSHELLTELQRDASAPGSAGSWGGGFG